MSADKKSNPKKLKTAVEVAAIEAQAAVEKFPEGLKESFALLAEIKGEVVTNEDEGEARSARITALSKHIAAIQQGLPLVHSKSGDQNHQHFTSVISQMKLDRLTRTNPEVKELLADKKASETKLAAIAELVSTATDLAALKTAVAAL